MTIGANYVSYVIAWVNKVPSITPVWSRITLLVVLTLSICTALGRVSYKPRGEPDAQYSFLSVLILSVPGLLILIWSVHGILDDPVGVVAANLTGGDHSMHVGLSLNFTNLTGSPYLRNPFDLYGYPSALHFLITNLAQLDLIQNDTSPVFHFHLMAAWFERLQFAAFVQLFVSVAVLRITRSTVNLIVGTLLSVVSLLLIPNSIPQLIWSGFSTSLGGVWILLLVPFFEILILERGSRNMFQTFLLTVVGAVLVSVYQPLLMIVGSVFVLQLSSKLFVQKIQHPRFITSYVRPALLGFITAALPISVVYFVQGKGNSGFQTINLTGALLLPSHTIAVTIFVLTAFLLYGCVIRTKNKGYQYSLGKEIAFIFGYLGLLSSLIFVISQIKDDSQPLTPYYVDKLIWGLVFVCLPILLMAMFSFFDSFNGFSRRAFWVTAALAIPLVFVTRNLEIKQQFRHTEINWVASALQTIQREQLPLRAVTYFSGDHLGSHVGTLSIGWVSDITLPFELRITNRIDLVCDFISNQGVTTVFTADGGLDELITNGCPDSGVNYIESSL
jgi:hypothetical protein